MARYCWLWFLASPWVSPLRWCHGCQNQHYMVHYKVHTLILMLKPRGKLMRILQNQQYWQRVVDSISKSWGQAQHSIKKNGYLTNSVKYVKALLTHCFSWSLHQWELWNDNLASENTWYLCFYIFLIHLVRPSFGSIVGNIWKNF
jgi:hypothetical protein